MEERQHRLKELLDKENYPLLYLFKFIIRQDHDKMVAIKRCFDETAQFEIHPSKNGNYISINIRQIMLNSDDVLQRYERVAQIKDVIVL